MSGLMSITSMSSACQYQLPSAAVCPQGMLYFLENVNFLQRLYHIV